MYKLPLLGMNYADLEPHIDAQTMEIHYTKHHQAYVDNLNVAIQKHPELDNKPLKELLINFDKMPSDIKGAIQNHGGGHHNHSLFWLILKKNGGAKPTGKLLEMINRDLGSFENFKEQFETHAKSKFGSGWAWLVVNKNNKLEVTSTSNQDSPLMFGQKPVLGLDVWEHAYYLKYQNRRIDYIKEFWNVINWDNVLKFIEDSLTLECDK